MKRKIKYKNKRKNPYNSIEEVISKLELNPYVQEIRLLGQGAFGDVYYFYLPQRTFILNDIFLDKGEYAIKILFGNHKYGKEDIKKLEVMSKYGIIPKIFYIDKNSMIMKYIDGITLKEFRKKYPFYSLNEIKTKIEYLQHIWWQIGKFSHEDLHDGNILITKDLKVYLIDPI